MSPDTTRPERVTLSAPESLRDEVAAVLAEAYYEHCGWYWAEIDEQDRADCIRSFGSTTDALLTSPALVPAIRKAKAEAWDEGLKAGRVWAEVDGRWPANPYREEQALRENDDAPTSPTPEGDHR